MDKTGTLFLVGTPIGNLGDITYRAVQVLKEVDLIAAEDTRRTKILLQHYGISTQLTSYFEYNRLGKEEQLLKSLQEGKNIALVSDAGMPGISDPGFNLIREAIRRYISLEIIPGPSALISGLILSGLPTHRFAYEGFLSSKSSARRKRLNELITEERTMIFYESPYRLLSMLKDVNEILGDRHSACIRELTKKFQEAIRGKVSELIAHFNNNKPRGEFVVVVSGKEG
ncbi:MAG: 16S rRNA (cytidine(1402)-2'-O)-methyltransferase [Candidatus Omnitrophica bacterium]|nr:16S rRNA (cytidine(1402)-2'-O)-methyltransferase [Candidatus Omnitrophota bacterium]